MQHVESRFSARPKHEGKAANVVFLENEYSAESKGDQNKIADTFTITTVCRVGLDRTSCGKTVTKSIILYDFSLEKWGFPKTYGTDPVSTGLKHLEWMICSRVCSALNLNISQLP